ncbi:MAG: type II toxin-antitoxin system RelE/ParE family toxin [Bacteroidia bacterium]
MGIYILNEEAIADINDIWFYTAQTWSVEQADRYYNLILDEIEYIADNFESSYDFGRLRKGYRYSKVKSHLIFYRKSDENEIEVVRILHKSMDIDKRL